jgi:hypothetical protein
MDETPGGDHKLDLIMLSEAREDVANADQKASTVLVSARSREGRLDEPHRRADGLVDQLARVLDGDDHLHRRTREMVTGRTADVVNRLTRTDGWL